MKKVILLLCLSVFVSSSLGATKWLWEDLIDDFNNDLNWDNDVPDCNVVSEVNPDGAVCVISSPDTMTTSALNIGRNVSQPLTYGVPTVRVDGGSLLVQDCSANAGNMNVAGFDSSSLSDVPGRLEVINEGYVNCNYLTLGKYGPAELYMDSGLIECQQGSWVARYNDQPVTIDLAGGTFDAGTLYWYNDTVNEPDIYGVQDINIHGGTLIFSGDETSTMETWVAKGRLYSQYDGTPTPGTVLINYDSGQGETVVTSINQPPLKVTNPAPGIGVSIDVFDPVYGSLSWDGTAYTTNYDVYLGVSEANVLAADDLSPQFVGNVTTETIDLGSFGKNLDIGTTYYWRVDGKDSSSSNVGDVWNFTVLDYAFIGNWNDYTDLTEMAADGWTFDSAQMTMSQTPGGNNYVQYCIDTLDSETLTKTYSSSIDLTSNGDFVNFVLRHASPDELSVSLTLKDSTTASETVNMGTTGVLQWTDLWIDFSEFSSVDPTDVIEFTLTFTSDGQATCIDIAGILAYPVTCFEQPDSDLSGDCIVNIEDFSILAGEWLTDGF
jgi:hypothetical protein